MIEELIKLSVIIPVYNVEKYLKKCINSVLGQTLEGIEIILVDDGSTDSSGKICDEYQDKAVIIHKKNGGLSSARNTGMKVARGEYIAFLDSDDYVDPETYNTVYEIALSKKTDIVFFNYVIEKDGCILNGNDYLPSRRIIKQDEIKELLIEKNSHNMLWFSWKSIFKKSFLNDNKIFFIEENVVEDSLFNLEALLCAESIWFEDKPFYHYVQSPNSLTRTPYKKDYWIKLNNSYIIRKEISNKYRLKNYELNLCDYSMRHSIVVILSNELAKEGAVLKSDLKVIRESELVNEAFKYSKTGLINSRLKYLAILLKYRCYFLLSIMFEISTKILKKRKNQSKRL